MESGKIEDGGMAERLNAPVLKTVRVERLSGVRIPPKNVRKTGSQRTSGVGTDSAFPGPFFDSNNRALSWSPAGFDGCAVRSFGAEADEFRRLTDSGKVAAWLLDNRLLCCADDLQRCNEFFSCFSSSA